MDYEKKILVAKSSIVDPIFAGSVIFIFKHTEQGASGMILNSTKEIGRVAVTQSFPADELPKYLELKKQLADLNLPSLPILMGGPCKTPSFYFLHGYEEFLDNQDDNKSEFDLGIPNSFDVGNGYNDEFSNPNYVVDGFYFGNPQTLSRIVEANKLKENKCKFFAGCAIWGEGQLEHEIESGAWEVMEPSSEMFFDEKELDKLVKKVGGKSIEIKPQLKISGLAGTVFPALPVGFNPECN